jgi:Cu-processing system permease protein
MNALVTLAGQEVRAGFRNRWVLATTVVMAALALSLALLGSAPGGTVGAAPLAVVVVSLASLTIFLVPLIALLLSFDTIVGEAERGTLLLLLAYPINRWQVILGKFLGQVAILGVATVLGYGAAGLVLTVTAGGDTADWQAFAGLIGSSILLGAVFVALGGLASVAVRERATAAGLAVGLWLVFVLLYDMALLGLLVADQGATVGASLLDLLLLLNPTDAYRLLNLTGDSQVATLTGMIGPNEGAIAPPFLLVSLLAWTLVPLGLAAAIFHRRQP